MHATGRGPYDICIAHLADARFYPLFQRQAFALRDRGYRVAFVSWENASGEGDPHWPGIDTFPITLPANSFSGKLFFARYMRALTLKLRALPSRLYQAVDPVTLPGARLAASTNRASYCYFSLEYFQGTSQLVGRRLTAAVWRVIERWGLGRCRASAVVCADTARRLAQLYAISTPSVIHNVPPSADYDCAPDDSFRTRLGVGTNVPLAVFKGDVAEARGLVPFVRAMAQVPEVHLAVLGSGPLREQLEQLSACVGVAARVHWAGRVEPHRVAPALMACDLGHVLHENIGANMATTLPSKLFDCMHAGLPILCGNQGEMAQIVRSGDLGWSVDPGDESAVASALGAFVAMYRSGGLDAYRSRARTAARNYRWEDESVKYCAWVEQAMAGGAQVSARIESTNRDAV